jgi:oligopeptide transport system permease protein
MIRLLWQRLLWAIPVLWLVLTITFVLLRVAPGGPFDSERQLTTEAAAQIAAKYQLDQPVVVQYGRYLGQVLQGDLGPSFQYPDQSVNELIAYGLPISATLGVLALILALLIGLPLGVVAAKRANKTSDLLIGITAVLGISVPNFVIGPLLILALAVYWPVFPVGGWNGGHIMNVLLPVITLALPYIAYITRLFRGALLDELQKPYITTARAKGCSESRVLWVHAFKPAMLPVVSFLGPASVGLITGSVVVEQIFGLPGMGRYFVQGALNRDYTLVLGVVLVVALLMLVMNTVADLLYRLLDPRSRDNEA